MSWSFEFLVFLVFTMPRLRYFYKNYLCHHLILISARFIDYPESLVRARQKTAPAGVRPMSSPEFFLDSDPPVSGLASPRPVIAPQRFARPIAIPPACELTPPIGAHIMHGEAMQLRQS
jgi:hypothetical protein